MKKFDQINVIPFIDVMLVALAIVLLTATFIVQGELKIQLASAKHSQSSDTQPRLNLQIDANEQLYWQQQALSLAALELVFKDLDKNSAISLQVDKSVPFASFAAVIDLCQQYQLDKLSIRVLKAD